MLALLLLSPWNHLVNINALPDTFGIVILFNIGSHHASAAVAVVAIGLLFAIVGLRGRLIALLPLIMLGLLVGSSVSASNHIRDRVSYDQRNLVGVPPDWISRITHAPTAYFYDGESYWNGVWQVRFWNRNITDVVRCGTDARPGPDAAARGGRSARRTAADP